MTDSDWDVQDIPLGEKPMRVLLIEDEAMIALDISAILERNGGKVCAIARTKAEAVWLAKKEKPDLIVADIGLADQSSGLEAISEIHQSIGDVRVIFVTGNPELTSHQTVTKPYREEQLSDLIRSKG